jgi:hypothetical protein
MRAKVKPAHQIQRINLLQNKLASLKELEHLKLIKRPSQKAWCCVEVLKHMIVAQKAYEIKIDKALIKSKGITDEIEDLSTHAIPSFLIKRFPPIDGEIRLKMKTSKQFKPMLDVEALTSKDIDSIVKEMENALAQLENWVEQTRKKDVRGIRFNSAIGALVRFNASEACEFILCHNERHFQQVLNTVNSIKAEIKAS